MVQYFTRFNSLLKTVIRIGETELTRFQIIRDSTIYLGILKFVFLEIFDRVVENYVPFFLFEEIIFF